MGAELLWTVRVSVWPQLRIRTVAYENPRLSAIAKTDVEDFPKFLLGAEGEYGSDHLNPLGKVSVHPVCRTDEEFTCDWILLAIRKMKDSCVFEETSDNRSNAHSFSSARNSRPQAAKAANNQFDRDASLGSVTQSLDHVRIFQLVHLGDDSSRAAGAMILHLPADQFQQTRPHRLGATKRRSTSERGHGR